MKADPECLPPELGPLAANLALYSNASYRPGRGAVVRALWYLVSLLLFEGGWFPWSAPKRSILRMFGARVGRGLVLKPHVRIKYPWRLRLGDHVWIGQEVWIDNLEEVSIGSHVCLSQRVYLCTGSHDFRQETFDLITEPIRIQPGVWIGAGTIVLGGVTLHWGGVAAAGSVVVSDVPAGMIVAGVPARLLRSRSQRGEHA